MFKHAGLTASTQPENCCLETPDCSPERCHLGHGDPDPYISWSDWSCNCSLRCSAPLRSGLIWRVPCTPLTALADVWLGLQSLGITRSSALGEPAQQTNKVSQGLTVRPKSLQSMGLAGPNLETESSAVRIQGSLRGG